METIIVTTLGRCGRSRSALESILRVFACAGGWASASSFAFDPRASLVRIRSARGSAPDPRAGRPPGRATGADVMDDAQTNPFDDDSLCFVFLVDQRAQHSLRPVFATEPKGRRRAGGPAVPGAH
jgi:hypothetical protein